MMLHLPVPDEKLEVKDPEWLCMEEWLQSVKYTGIHLHCQNNFAVIFISQYCLISCRNGPDNYLLLLQVSDIQNYHTCCIVVQVRALDFVHARPIFKGDVVCWLFMHVVCVHVVLYDVLEGSMSLMNRQMDGAIRLFLRGHLLVRTVFTLCANGDNHSIFLLHPPTVLHVAAPNKAACKL